MILVTGATGTVGHALVRHLSEHGAAFKAMVRKDADRETLKRTGVTAVVADYADPVRLAEAMAGIEQIYLIGPADPPHISHEGVVIDAARQGAALKTTVEQTLMRGLATAGPCCVSGLPRSRSGRRGSAT